MLIYTASLALGTVTGVFTGLVPGIHPNTVVFSSIPYYLKFQPDLMIYISFMAGISVSHTFHDFLPAIFIGAPEAESALSALPGADMAMEGRGLEAFRWTVAGGAFSVAFLAVALPLLFAFLEPIYQFLEKIMFYVLAFFLFYLVFDGGNLWASAITATLSGLLGLLAFSMNVNQEFVLVPIFSGLFAFPAVIYALDSGLRLPEQADTYPGMESSARGGLTGLLAGFIAGTVPGLGAAASTSFLSPLLSSREEFLAGMGGVNSSDIVISFAALFLIGKARSGASVALSRLSEVGIHEVAFLIGASLLATSLSAPLALETSRHVYRFFRRIDFRKLLLAVILVLVLTSYWLNGLKGLLILAASAAIGTAALTGSSRRSCMSVLILPAMTYYAPAIFI